MKNLNNANPSDESLAKGASNGNDRDFAKLVERHQGRLLNIIYGILHDRDDAKDTLQDTWVKVWQCLKNQGYHEEQNFAGWISRIARNCAIDALSKKNHFIHDESLLSNAVQDEPDVDGDKVPDVEEINKAIDDLPTKMRRIVCKRVREGKGVREIALELGRDVATVTSTLVAARKKIVKTLTIGNVEYIVWKWRR